MSHRHRLGECQKIQLLVVRPTEHPVVAQDRPKSGGGGSYAVRMVVCHVDYAHSGLWQLTYHPPRATFARHRLSGQGLYRLQISIIWRGSRVWTGSECIETIIRERQHNNSRWYGWVRRGGSLFDKATQGSQSEFYVRMTGGARAQTRRLTGDVLGGLSPENPRGLRGDPAQRQRPEEMDCLRSC